MADKTQSLVLQDLTSGERLLLVRRRRGQTQRQAAVSLGIPISLYSQMERDLATTSARPGLKRLEPHERCLLHRRRSGATQSKVAKDLGVCRWWLNQMETGRASCEQLLSYWER